MVKVSFRLRALSIFSSVVLSCKDESKTNSLGKADCAKNYKIRLPFAVRGLSFQRDVRHTCFLPVALCLNRSGKWQEPLAPASKNEACVNGFGRENLNDLLTGLANDEKSGHNK